MGTGHEVFFHNKLKWLHMRHDKIRLECIKRGININLAHKFDYESLTPVAKMFFYNDWSPTNADHKINIERLQERFTLRKKAYTFTSVIKYENIDNSIYKNIIDCSDTWNIYSKRFDKYLN